ncbi:O-antigen ligase family protein [Halopseudomonas xiamenensis]|uniref:O-antigen ligase family protein n=1 Tax=Halopseudomonas xiamenensis TaxID=157792 RepID=UPI001628A0C5|nr:O-antigen ligase family protein [Halopseudomonas xiamenensis]
MIAALLTAALLAVLCLALLASPWPFLAPFAVIGLFALAALYRRPAWGLIGLILLVPFEGLFQDMNLSGAKLLGGALILVVALQFLQRRIPERYLAGNLWRPLLLLLLCITLSFMFSTNKPLSGSNLRELAIGMVLFPVTLLIGRQLNLVRLCQVMTLSVAVTCIIAIYSSNHQVGGRAIGLLQDANYFALLIAMALPLAVLMLLQATTLPRRLFWLGIVILLLAGMTKTDSRSGLVVLLLCMMIGAWHHRERLRRLRPKHLGFVMFGAALVLPLALTFLPDDYVERIKSLTLLKSGVNAHLDPSLGRRASYLLVGGEMIADNPMTGSGPGTFPVRYAFSGYAKAFSDNQSEQNLYRRAHNTYLEVFSEMGIPAGLFFIALIWLGLLNFIRARRSWLARDDRSMADMSTHLGLSLLAISLFLIFLSAPNHKYLWILLALSCVMRQQAENRRAVE